MGSYVPNTPEERQEMLRAIGLHDFRELYGDVPASMYLDRPLDLPSERAGGAADHDGAGRGEQGVFHHSPRRRSL